MTTRPGAIRYIERQPTAALAPWILSYWSFQADLALPSDEPYTVWPDGCLTIGQWRGPGAPPMLVCVGPRHTAIQPPVSAGARIWGVRLWPDAIEPMFGINARSLCGHVGPAPNDIRRRFASLAHELPESDDPEVVFPALGRWLDREFPISAMDLPDPRVRAAVRAIVAARGEVDMARVARASGLGLRQLQRRFPQLTGLTLREYARVRRLREALGIRLGSARRPGVADSTALGSSAAPGGWSRIAAESGFVDHAHLSREFAALTGMSPSAAARHLARTTHEDVVP